MILINFSAELRMVPSFFSTTKSWINKFTNVVKNSVRKSFVQDNADREDILDMKKATNEIASDFKKMFDKRMYEQKTPTQRWAIVTGQCRDPGPATLIL